MKKNVLYLLLTGFSLITVSGFAQLSTYTFESTTGTYTTLLPPGAGATDPKIVVLSPAQTPLTFSILDEGLSDFTNPIPIGFAFTYLGQVYNNIYANTNGIAAFSPFLPEDINLQGAYYTPDLAEGPLVNDGSGAPPVLVRPILAPLWDDMDMDRSQPFGANATPDLRYQTTGTTPNRIFTLEWSNVYWSLGASNPVISFQLKLYEGSNRIEFHYKTDLPEAPAVFTGAQIGITAGDVGNNNFISVQDENGLNGVSLTSVANITSKPANGRIFRFTPAVAAPVKLSSFTAIQKGTTNQLQWTTASENNNKGFHIQRSANGINFNNIAFVNSKASNGTSVLPLSYSYTDAQPAKDKNYYRLQQVDNDGTATFSTVVTVNNTAALSLAIQQLSPNPAQKQLTVQIQSPQIAKAELVITNLTGKIVKTQVLQLVKGSNTVRTDVQQLPASVYVLTIKSNLTAVAERFVKE